MAKVDLDQSSRLDITCRRGDTFNMSLTLKDSDGVVLPLVSEFYKFTMQVRGRKAADGNRPIVIGTDETTGVGHGTSVANDTADFVFNTSLTANAETGIVVITVPATEMRTVDPGSYTYDLQYVGPNTATDNVDGPHTTVLFGSFIINGDVAITAS